MCILHKKVSNKPAPSGAFLVCILMYLTQQLFETNKTILCNYSPDDFDLYVFSMKDVSVVLYRNELNSSITNWNNCVSYWREHRTVWASAYELKVTQWSLYA